MATGTSNFPNRPFRLRIEVWYNWQSGTSASLHVEVWIDKLSYSPTSSGCCSAYQVYVDSVGQVANWSGGFNFVSGNNFLIFSGDYAVTVNGNGDAGASAFAQYDILGATNTSAWHDGSPPSPPNAPTITGIESVTTTSFGVRYNRGSDNGNGIDYDHVQYGTDSGFGGIFWNDTPPDGNPNGYSNPAGRPAGPLDMTPGTNYWVRARSHNVNGWSGWSNTVSQSTLPATAPGISGAPSINGQSIVLTMTPPGGSSGVTEYNIEWREGGAGSVTALTSSDTTETIGGLTPGIQYQYRANAEIGSYTSPWSSWLPVTQPNPNTNPGNYFDGSSTDTPTLDYEWIGTTNNSQSRGMAFAVGGYTADFTAPAAGALYQEIGGYISTHAAKVSFTRDASAAAQWHAGQRMDAATWSEVEEGITYTYSIWVNPSRSQRLQARAIIHNGAGAAVGGTILGTAVVCPANTWTRLSVTTLTPAGGERGTVRVTDVAGTGFSVMLGGQYILLDGAMISLGSELLGYFDGTTLDTALYEYFWIGANNNSISGRRQNTTTTIDPLTDPDCEPFPAPPLPPTIPSDCIEEIGSWRRYTAQISAAAVPLWGSTLPTLVLSTGGSAERQVRIRYYPNPDGVAPELVDTTQWVAELILTYIPAHTDITLDGVAQRVWASVDDGDEISADQLLYGTGGVPASWPLLDCGIGYMITLDVPLDAPSGNLSTRVLLTQKV